LKQREGEPNVMWLSGLHIPESYLTALVQATCRKNGWPLDRSTLYTQVTQYSTAEDVTERAHQGCFVYGLSLEGAGWDQKKGCLIRQKPKELVQELPVMKVIPIESHKLKLQVRCVEGFYLKDIFQCLLCFLEHIPYTCIHDFRQTKCYGLRVGF
jgi:hypothetical protein